MRRRQASFTATGIAALRALESMRPAGERICYDPFARRFVNPAFLYFIKLVVDSGYPEKAGPGVMGFLVARARYMDDYLQTCCSTPPAPEGRSRGCAAIGALLARG